MDVLWNCSTQRAGRAARPFKPLPPPPPCPLPPPAPLPPPSPMPPPPPPVFLASAALASARRDLASPTAARLAAAVLEAFSETEGTLDDSVGWNVSPASTFSAAVTS